MLAVVAGRRWANVVQRVGKALAEDFGVRPPEPLVQPVAPAAPVGVGHPLEATSPIPAHTFAGVVWTGSVARSPELQRFVDHLSELRTSSRH